MPYGRRSFDKLMFQITVGDLGPADFVTLKCAGCGYRRIIATWELHLQSSPLGNLRMCIRHIRCPTCKVDDMTWGVVTARCR